MMMKVDGPNWYSLKQITTLIVGCLILFATSACAPRSEKKSLTKLRFSSGAITAADLTGIMVYGKSAGGEFIGLRLNSASDTRTIQLNNGTWDFMAVAWAGGANAMSGEVRCGFTDGVGLSGSDVTVNINVTQDGCNNPALAPDIARAGRHQFLPLSVYTCINSKAVLNSDPYECMGGKVGSVKIRLPEFTGTITSKSLVPDRGVEVCETLDTEIMDGMTINPKRLAKTDVRLPLFDRNQEAPIPVVIETYESLDCSGTSEVYTFNDGITGYPDDSRQSVMAYQSSTMIFTHHNYCTGTQLNGTPYANGFNASAPNFICTPAQLQSLINTADSSQLDSDYYLARDIDMAGISITDGIGDGSTGFSGTFNGLAQTISNLTMDFNGVSNGAGLFKSLTGSSAEISNLTILNPTLTSNSWNTGIVVGQIPSTTIFPKLSDIKIIGDGVSTNATFDGANVENCGVFAGRIDALGYLGDVELSNLSVIDERTSASMYFGFLAGLVTINTSSPLPMKNIALINPRYQRILSSTVIGIGGLIGSVSDMHASANLYIDSVDVVNLSMNLHDSTSGNQIGGLIGQADSVELKNFHVTGSITTNDPVAEQIGGAFGSINSGTSDFVKLSWGRSDVDINVPNANKVGGLIGAQASSQNNSLISKNIYSAGVINCRENCGGVIGLINGSSTTLNDLHSEALITAATGFSGGLVGFADFSPGGTLSLDSCSFAGSVTNSGGNVGGIIGYLSPDSTNAAITNCLVGGGPLSGGGDYEGILFAKYENPSFDLALQNIIIEPSTLAITASSGFIANGTVSPSNIFEIGGTSIAGTTPVVLDGTQASVLTSAGFNTATNWQAVDVVGVMPTLHGQAVIDLIGEFHTGSRYDPIPIFADNQLANVGKYFALMDKVISLESDIDLTNYSDSDYHPIGTISNPFTGAFIGNDFTISNLSITSASGNLGLFGVIGPGAQICDFDQSANAAKLTLEGFNINSTAGGNVGALVGLVQVPGSTGRTDGVSIRDVDVIAGASGASIQGETNVGGVIGHLDIVTNSSDHRSRLDFIWNEADVTGTGAVSAGGIIGHISTDANALPSVLETNLLINNGNVQGNSEVGGIVGTLTNAPNDLAFKNLYSMGTITGTLSDVGGLIGRSFTSATGAIKFDGCGVNTLFITGVGDVGGFFGEENSSLELTNCIFVGSVDRFASNVGLFIGLNGGGTKTIKLQNVFGIETNPASLSVLLLGGSFPSGSSFRDSAGGANNFKTAINLTSAPEANRNPSAITRFTNAQMTNPQEVQSVIGIAPVFNNPVFITTPGEFPDLWFPNLFYFQQP